MPSITEVTKYLLIFVAAMFGSLVMTVIAVLRLPNDNALKRILHAFVLRAGATLGAGVLAVPIEPIPGLDGLYDIAAPLMVLYYWFTFIRKAIAILQRPSLIQRNSAVER